MTLSLRTLRALLIGLSILSLAACHSSSDDDDEDEPEDESAVGHWLGTYRLNGSPNRAFVLFAAPSGQFTGLINPTNSTSNDSRIIVGVGDVTGAQLLVTSGTMFPQTGTTLPGGAASATISAFSGNVAEGVSLSGSFTAGSESGTFALNYDATTGRGSSLAAVQGVYSTTGNTATMTVTSGGQLTFNAASGCVGNGTILPTDASVNIYSWSMTITAPGGSTCTSAGTTSGGLASLIDFNGVQNNRLVMMAALPDRAFYFVGAK